MCRVMGRFGGFDVGVGSVLAHAGFVRTRRGRFFFGSFGNRNRRGWIFVAAALGGEGATLRHAERKSCWSVPTGGRCLRCRFFLTMVLWRIGAT